MKVTAALEGLAARRGESGKRLLRQKLSGVVVAALTFAVGVASWGLWARQAKPACSPLLVEVRTENRQGKFDSFEYETCRGKPSFGGRYQSDAYGFSVRLPDGAVSARPTPYAGFALSVRLPRGRLEEVVNTRLRALREQGTNVRLLTATPTALGGLSAVRVAAGYEKDGVEMVSDEVVAYRGEGVGEESVVYTLDLSTRLADYERDRPVLEEMQQSWRLRPPR